jgi:hypothetical protein
MDGKWIDGEHVRHGVCVVVCLKKNKIYKNSVV